MYRPTNHKKHCYNEHNTQIHCILLNARNIVRKVDELKLLVHDENSDIIFITESRTAFHELDSISFSMFCLYGAKVKDKTPRFGSS